MRNKVVRAMIENPKRNAGRHSEVRRNVARNLETRMNGMCWDDWVEWAERRDLSPKQTLLGREKKYREMYVSQMDEGETND